jgi:putative transposase
LAYQGENPKSGDFGFREDDLMSNAVFKTAPHNPPHFFVAGTLYMLTGAIYRKTPLMISDQRKADWQDGFHKAAEIYGWQIIAWVALHNHYHAIVRSPANAGNLSKFVNSYHKYTARKWNTEDGLSGRKVWWNYWDTCIRSERDYYRRLRYLFSGIPLSMDWLTDLRSTTSAATQNFWTRGLPLQEWTR